MKPVRFVYSGDKIKGKEYHSLGRTVFGIGETVHTGQDSFIFQKKFDNGLIIRAQKTLNNDKIIYIHVPLVPSGGWNFVFSPSIIGNSGWDSPFTRPLSPYGTVLGLPATQDERHKVALRTGTNLVHRYGENYFDIKKHPGNQISITEDNKVISWWSTQGFGEVEYLSNQPPWNGLRLGDIVRYFGYDYDHVIITGGIDGSGATYTYEFIGDLCHSVYIDGLEYPLPNLELSPNGHAHVKSVSLVGDWLLYICTDTIYYSDAEFNNWEQDFFHAYNIVTEEHREFDYLPYIGSGGDTTMRRFYSSLNGKKAVGTYRDSTVNAGTILVEITFTFDIDNNPTGYTYSTSVPVGGYLYYGYSKTGNKIAYPFSHNNTTDTYNAQVKNFDAKNYTAWGYIDTAVPVGADYYIAYDLWVHINDKVFYYTVDRLTGFISIKDPDSTYNTIAAFINAFDKQVEFYNTPKNLGDSRFIPDIGWMLCLPNPFYPDNNNAYTSDNPEEAYMYNRFSILIDYDGKMTPIDEYLLNNTYGADLNTAPFGFYLDKVK
jgi:hypothetical protein